MTGSNARAALAHTSEQAGWRRHVDERVDVYTRGDYRVRVIWRGDDHISGGSRFTAGLMETYTRELGTVEGWLR